jgi:hypothetical protein
LAIDLIAHCLCLKNYVPIHYNEEYAEYVIGKTPLYLYHLVLLSLILHKKPVILTFS